MSRRMSFPLTLAGLVAAAAPAVAQPPAPPVRDAAWSFSVSRPASEPQPVQPAGYTAPAVAPAPRPANTARRGQLDDTFSRTTRTATVVLTAAQPPCCATACGETACPTPAAGGPVQVVMAGPARPAPALPVAVAVRSMAAAYRPLGTWYKEMPGAVLTLTFGDELTIASTQDYGDGPVTSAVTADYTVTPAGTVHGVVTGSDADTAGSRTADPAAHSLLAGVLREGVDQAFAFRCRPTAGGLMVSNTPFELAPTEGEDRPGCTFDGRYTFAPGGKAPAPKPARRPDRAGLAALPAPPVVERLGVDFNPNPPVSVRCIGPLCPTPGAAGVSFVTPLAPCPAPVVLPQPCPTAPPVAVAPVTYSAPLPTFTSAIPAPPLPAPTAPVLARANPLPVGTWCREVGPVRMTLAVKDTTLSLTTTITVEGEGKTVTQGLLVTADCYPTRDGLVGVVTGADLVLDGDLGPVKDLHLVSMVADIGKVQKALVDKPLALSCRVVDGCLMVGNVRLAAGKLDGGSFEGLEDGSLVAGRYKPVGEKGLPAPKPAKVGVEMIPGMTLPSTLEHYPQYFAPDPAFPLPRELDLQVVTIERCEVAPEPRPAVKAAACDNPRRPDLRNFSQYDSPGFGIRVECNEAPAGPAKMTTADVMTLTKAGLGDEVIVTQLRVTGSTFVLSVADLVALKRAGVSEAVIVAMQAAGPDQPTHLTPERIHGGVSYSPDPNVRMQQLLNQSEDLRQIGEEWRRFWFRDQPSHLTPERVHGGIMQNTTPAAGRQVFTYSLGLLHGGR